MKTYNLHAVGCMRNRGKFYDAEISTGYGPEHVHYLIASKLSSHEEAIKVAKELVEEINSKIEKIILDKLGSFPIAKE